MSSSDGQRFPVPVKARNARALPRYLHGKGLTFYTWTSDQLSQYGTKVTVITMRDSTYVLDEILDNITDLPTNCATRLRNQKEWACLLAREEVKKPMCIP